MFPFFYQLVSSATVKVSFLRGVWHLQTNERESIAVTDTGKCHIFPPLSSYIQVSLSLSLFSPILSEYCREELAGELAKVILCVCFVFVCSSPSLKKAQ